MNNHSLSTSASPSYFSDDVVSHCNSLSRYDRTFHTVPENLDRNSRYPSRSRRQDARYQNQLAILNAMELADDEIENHKTPEIIIISSDEEEIVPVVVEPTSSLSSATNISTENNDLLVSADEEIAPEVVEPTVSLSTATNNSTENNAFSVSANNNSIAKRKRRNMLRRLRKKKLFMSLKNRISEFERIHSREISRNGV